MNWEGRDYVLIEALYRHLPGCAKKKARKTSVTVAGIPAETPTKDLPNKSLGCYQSACLLSTTRDDIGESGRMFPVSTSSPASSRRRAYYNCSFRVSVGCFWRRQSSIGRCRRGIALLLCNQKASVSNLSSEIEFHISCVAVSLSGQPAHLTV
jgi:hypothetical protein